jgi:hypothetical protein
MKRFGGWIVALAVCTAVGQSSSARGDDQFLDALSHLATREVRKQLRDKPLHFAQGPLEGDVTAVEPDTRLEALVKEFQLGGDLVNATVIASGRFKLLGKVNREADVTATVDVTFTAVTEARFIKEGEKYFIEPKIKDLSMALSILELAPSNLSGGSELLAGLATAAFNSNKDKIIADVNKRLGKRPF